MTTIENKTAIITRASRGIGAAAARHLANHGARVVLAARSNSDIEAISAEICEAGGQAVAFECDVGSHLAVAALIAFAKEKYGSVDILKGVYHGLRYALPVMRQQGSGTVINISSGAANSALEGWSQYCASKAAVLRLTGVAHKENAADGITVVGLSPGTVATEMQVSIKESGINPVSQLDPSVHIPAEWVAQAIGFLCGPKAQDYAGGDFSLKTDEGRKVAGILR